MTSKPKAHSTTYAIAATTTDSYLWNNQYGGSWSVAGNWTDSTTGTTATSAPGAGNAVTINGGSIDYLNITGTGAAASLTASGGVLLWGTLAVGGALTLASYADFELDGAASLSAASIGGGTYATVEVGGGSKLTVSGGVTLSSGLLTATGASTAQFGTLIMNAGYGYGYGSGTVAVDDNSSIEVGSAGGAALGAVTIDKAQAAALTGSLYGNVVVNGTLGVQAGGQLNIDEGYNFGGGYYDPYGTATAISGTGTLTMSEGSRLFLGVADSAAIQFTGPRGVLQLAVLPTGTISGFGAGDTIELFGLATAVSYQQTSASVATLTFSKGGKAAGTLTLAGSFTGSRFHLNVDSFGFGYVTLQTPGGVPTQPSVIQGTVGADYLRATANNQTLTGLGGGDSLDGAGYVGIDFKDTSANTNGATLYSFDLSDTLDLTDMTPGGASVSASFFSSWTGSYYAVTVADGVHSASVSIHPAGSFPIGYFAASADGAGGTNVRYVTVNTDAYAWSNPLGGGYALAGNWADTTTGVAATVKPSYGNAVTIAGGFSYLDVTGNGAAASLTTSGDVLLSGSLAVGYTVTGVSGALNQSGTLAIGGGASLSLSGSASLAGLVAAEGGTLTVVGVLYGGNINLLASGGGVVQFGTAYPGYYGASLNSVGVDALSSIEIGTAGSAAKGALSIDSGVSASLSGTIYGNVVVNGTLSTGYPGATIAGFGGAAGSVSGGGTLQDSNSLTLAGADSAAIVLGSRSLLTLSGALPTGTITGFTQGNIITLAQSVTALSYAAGSNGTGTLTLSNGATTVGTLTLAGTYAANQFLLQPAGTSQQTAITYLPTPSTTPGAQISTNTDSYSWSNSAGGVWGNAANWSDTTVGGVATAAPGANNAVTIGSYYSASNFIVSGTGAAASLNARYAVFTGNITVGGAVTASNVFLAGGARMTAGSASGQFQLTGGSSLTVGGTLNGGAIVVGGSAVKVAGQGGADTLAGNIAVDATSTLELGATGGAAAGALTVDTGQTLNVAAGSFFSYNNFTIAANLIVNGRLTKGPFSPYATAAAVTLEGFGGTVGAVSGSGTIEVDAGSRLVLKASDSAAIALVSYSNYGNTYYPTLELAGPLPTGTISGFAAGDVIQVDQTVTGFSFVQTSATLATVTLGNGGTAVGSLLLAGNFASGRFHVDVAAGTGVATITLQAAIATAGTSTVNTGHDAYAWIGASGGSWTSAANWTDTTTGATATTAPGAGNAVTIAGATTANMFTTVGAGSAAAASLSVSGNVLLVGTATVAGQVAVTQVAGAAALSELSLNAAKLTAATASLGGISAVGQASTLSVTGTASLAGTLEADRFSTVQLGALVGSGTIAIDGASQLRIGTPVTPANGALSQAAGTTVALAGAIFGSVATAGTLAVLGGGALMIDMAGALASDPYAAAPTVGGAGTLSISEYSTLGLGAVDSAAIQFAGPNGSLLLAALPTATIGGFAVGDRIVVDKPVTGLSYAQTTATAATLTLTNGAATIGTLNLAGGFGGSLAFHLDPSLDGTSTTISLLSVGVAAAQPTLIRGTAGSDLLIATANGQTISGLAGADTLSGAAFSALTFKDLTANLSGDTIQNFATSDLIDFTDMQSASATATYSGGVLSVTDGTHTAKVNIGFASPPASGSFVLSSDGGSGTQAVWHA